MKDYRYRNSIDREVFISFYVFLAILIAWCVWRGCRRARINREQALLDEPPIEEFEAMTNAASPLTPELEEIE